MRRRTFLKLAGVGGVAAGAGMLGSRLVSADDPPNWGALPPGIWPGTPPHYKILEIFLYGGLSPWETFYHRPTAPAGTPLAAFAGFDANPAGAPGLDLVSDMAWATCAGTPSPSTQTLPFQDDISLGPFTKPLWADHIRQRMRLVVLSHNLLPHEAAIPYALTGLRLGRPQLAGMGAAVQRWEQARDRRTLPYSYVCAPMSFRFAADNLQAATAVGAHPASARPLKLSIGRGADSVRDMVQRRAGVGAATDGLLRQYRSQYRDQLRRPGLAEPTRSKAFTEYNAALESLFGSPALRGLLAAAPLTMRQDAPCLDPAAAAPLDNMPGTAIRLAAYLLTRPTAPARYVCVIDNGLEEAPSGGGYDTHGENHLRHTGVNLWNTLGTLADVIRDPAAPRPGDADRISLDDTLILLTTEFGRTPFRSASGSPTPSSNGRDHWTSGYVNALIGGPVQAGRHGIAGVINNNGRATSTFTPTDLRAAALMAAGINPFAADIFGVGDVSSAVSPSGDEAARLNGLRQKILNVA